MNLTITSAEVKAMGVTRREFFQISGAGVAATAMGTDAWAKPRRALADAQHGQIDDHLSLLLRGVRAGGEHGCRARSSTPRW